MIAFVIWSIVSAIFLIIGINACKAKEAVGFFTFTDPPKIKNVKAYNHAVGKLWVVFAIILEALGVPLLFAKQNSPIFIITILGVMVLVIGIIIVYLKIEEKYKE